MTVSLCIAGLGVIIVTSWYSFMSHLARLCERRRRLEQQLELKRESYDAHPFDNNGQFLPRRHDAA